eukprot:354727-Chlamydomonas_euryale.AAC.3
MAQELRRVWRIANLMASEACLILKSVTESCKSAESSSGIQRASGPACCVRAHATLVKHPGKARFNSLACQPCAAAAYPSVGT